MTTPISFAPLAGRLAAKAAEIRPAEGAEISWANFIALFWWSIFQMLIALCEALDARAAADAARLGAAPALRDVAEAAIPTLGAKRQAPSGERRAPRPALVPAIEATSSTSHDAPPRTAGRPAPAAPWLAWSRDPGPIRAVHAPPWRPRRETRLFQPRSRMPTLLQYRNEIGIYGDKSFRGVGWNALHSTASRRGDGMVE